MQCPALCLHLQRTCSWHVDYDRAHCCFGSPAYDRIHHPTLQGYPQVSLAPLDPLTGRLWVYPLPQHCYCDSPSPFDEHPTCNYEWPEQTALQIQQNDGPTNIGCQNHVSCHYQDHRVFLWPLFPWRYLEQWALQSACERPAQNWQSEFPTHHPCRAISSDRHSCRPENPAQVAADRG